MHAAPCGRQTRGKAGFLPCRERPHARAQVAAFQCLQPFVGTILAFVVLGEEPSPWDLGAVGIFAGLYLIVSDKKDLLASHPVVTGMRRMLSQHAGSAQNLLALSQLPGLPAFRAHAQPKAKAAKSQENSV